MRLKTLILMCFIGLLMWSCKAESGTDADPVAARFSSLITKAVGLKWSVGDQIGVFMTSSSLVSGSTILQGADNVAYRVSTSTTDGLFEPVGQAITYPTDGSEVTFVAYYPYTNISGYVLPIDVADQRNPELLDVMAAMESGKSQALPSVTLLFEREMSNLVVNLTSSVYSQSQMQTVLAKVTGLNTKADYDLKDRTMKNQSSLAKITLRVVEPGRSYQSVLLPGAVAAKGATLEFEIDGKTLTYAIPTEAFVGGKRYTYNLVLGSVSVTSINATIKDWIDDPMVNNGTAM